MVLSPSLLPQQEETAEERAARVQRLAQLVRGGAYAVHSRRLAMALLDWDPRRSAPRPSSEVADRRRAYMREYMRRRRAQKLADLAAPAPGTNLPPGALNGGSGSTLTGTNSSPGPPAPPPSAPPPSAPPPSGVPEAAAPLAPAGPADLHA